MPMKTMSIKFYPKPIQKGDDKVTIYVRILYSRTKAEFSTGIRCRMDDWDQEKETFFRSTHLNQKITSIKENIYRAKNILDDSGSFYEAPDIKGRVNGQKIKGITLLDFMQRYIDDKRKEGRVTQSTIQKYKETQKHVTDFCSEEGLSRISISEFNINFITRFNDYLNELVLDEFGHRLSIGTVNKHHARLKAIINYAIYRELRGISPYLNFKLSFPNSKREYLQKHELESLKSLDLQSNDGLDKARDIFLFSCYTGLRYQDAIELTMDRIILVGNEPYLNILQGKTGESREIPLLNPAKELIAKYSMANERIIKNRVLPTLSNPLLNQYLKIIARLAGIEKRLSHHIARHTCATTVLLDNAVPIETVSHWLGHNNIRTTQIYAKVSHSNLSKESSRLNRILT